jgi:3-oxoacyl-[acyl-carrier protein] reductase
VTAIVTGAGRGIGRAIAERLLADQRVLLVDLDPGVAAVAGELGAEAVVADVTDPAGRAAILEAVDEVDLLVNNAGITRDGRVAQLADEDFAGVIAVNLVAALRLTVELHPLLVPGASVVNLSSRAALGNFGQCNYVAAKAGLIGATRALALRWAPVVRVNAVAPGLIDTPMTQAMPDAVREKLVARIPLGRIGTPDDVAGVVAFLAGDDARYVTGQVLLCCGGRSVAP